MTQPSEEFMREARKLVVNAVGAPSLEDGAVIIATALQAAADKARAEERERNESSTCGPVSLTYTNYRGETSVRTITPRRVWFGSTEWHPEPQWLLTAVDHEKGAERDFALKEFGAVPDGYALVTIRPTDEMIKAADLSEEGWAAEIWSAMLAAIMTEKETGNG